MPTSDDIVSLPVSGDPRTILNFDLDVIKELLATAESLLAADNDFTGRNDFAQQYGGASQNLGDITGATTVDWDDSNVQYGRMTGDVTLTLDNEHEGYRYLLRLKSDGSARTPTFPGSVVWVGVAAPGAVAAGKRLVVSLVYVGGEYVGNWSVES